MCENSQEFTREGMKQIYLNTPFPVHLDLSQSVASLSELPLEIYWDVQRDKENEMAAFNMKENC